MRWGRLWREAQSQRDGATTPIGDISAVSEGRGESVSAASVPVTGVGDNGPSDPTVDPESSVVIPLIRPFALKRLFIRFWAMDPYLIDARMQRLKLEGTPRVKRTRRQMAPPLSPLPASADFSQFMLPEFGDESKVTARRGTSCLRGEGSTSLSPSLSTGSLFHPSSVYYGEGEEMGRPLQSQDFFGIFRTFTASWKVSDRSVLSFSACKIPSRTSCNSSSATAPNLNIFRE
jgi:hypothetical protein